MEPTARQQRAPRNRTITLDNAEILSLSRGLLQLKRPVGIQEVVNKTIYQDSLQALKYLPKQFVDLVFVDPPYNLNKKFNLTSFNAMETKAYEQWLDSWVQQLVPLLKPCASVYLCGDWRSSTALFNVANKYFTIKSKRKPTCFSCGMNFAK